MDKDLLDTAIRNFSSNSGFTLDFDEKGVEGAEKLFLRDGLESICFSVKLKSRALTSQYPQLLEELGENSDTVLVAGYIPKTLRARLRAENVNYIDGAGNSFLSHQSGLLVYIETHQNLRNFDSGAGRAFSKSGLKVVFHFLRDESILNKPYRDIGELSKVSIDTVGQVLRGLLRQGYILQVREKEYCLGDRLRLLHEWVTLYNKVLKPKLKQQRFRLKQGSLQDLTDATGHDTVGGELAAAHLSGNLIAERGVLYIEGSFIEAALRLGLVPDKSGDILFIQKFWSSSSSSECSTVHPLLIYADLIDRPTPRNLEAAKTLFDEYLR